MKLLKQLCQIHAPSGSEYKLGEFLLKYIEENKSNWKNQPIIHHGEDFQDCIVLVFGKPTTAIFAHMDSVGFTARYDNELIKIGGPITKKGIKLVGEDSEGPISTTIISRKIKDRDVFFANGRKINTGTTLTFDCNFRETSKHIQSCFLDNRLGVWNALRQAETLENGIICFSSWEEHGGGSIGYLAKFIYEKYKVRQALISDITWVTDGVHEGKGVVVSMRDSGIPRRSYLNKILEYAKKSKIPFQIEVEGSGGSDGNSLQKSPYPFDWCFIGAPEQNYHSPDEMVHKNDIDAMLKMYSWLMKHL